MLDGHIKDAVREKRKTVILGDILNNGVSAGSRHTGLEWGDCMDPMAQVELATETLMPLAKAGLLKLIVGGNHPFRSVKACGLHPEKIIAMLLSIAADGRKPESVLPSIVQRVQELSLMGEAARAGGRQYGHYQNVREKLLADIRKVAPGTEERWAVPFFPGVGRVTIEGVPIAAYHGKHSKSQANWTSLERVSHGFRVYLTGHNHSLAWQADTEAIRGRFRETDFFSCGTYQGYEDYAAVAAYKRTPIGSMLIEYDHDKDKVYHEKLD